MAEKNVEMILWPPSASTVGSNSIMTLKKCVQSKSSPVSLYVYRADLMGVQGVGQYGGLFHTGLAFSADEQTWVLDICAIGSLEDAVIPLINQDNQATMDGRVSLGYYPPTESWWDTYWKADYRSKVICTITGAQYHQLVDYILGDFVAAIKSYTLFQLQTAPVYVNSSENTVVSSSATLYTNDFTCDSLPYKIFEYAKNKMGVVLQNNFPILKVVVNCDKAPVKITDRKDPELIAFVKKIQLLKAALKNLNIQNVEAILTLIKNKDYVGAEKMIKDIISELQPTVARSKNSRSIAYSAHAIVHANAAPGEPLFFYSLDRKTGNPDFFRVLKSDSSVTTESGLYKISKPDTGINYKWWLLALCVVIIVFLVIRKIFIKK
jgi:hypothetical protein